MEFSRFLHDGFDLAFIDEGEGDPVLLIHGFASNIMANWVDPGWVKTLTNAGYRAIAFDNRGHGLSSKSYRPGDYTPEKMASDATALFDHLDIDRAHVKGYSMGARIAAFMAVAVPQRVATVTFGGLGTGMVDGVGDWNAVAEALLAEDRDTITDRKALAFRVFADQTGSDRQALAACISESRKELTPTQLAAITMPALVAVGSRDDIGGSAAGLAALLPKGEAFVIEGRDHMLSVGDRRFKARQLEFFEENPL